MLKIQDVNNFIFGILFFFNGFFVSHSQINEGEYLIEQISNYYSNLSDYTMDLEFNMYRGFEKKLKTESYVGKVMKSDNKLKLSLLEYVMYQYEKMQLTISDTDRLILVNNKLQIPNPALLYNQLKLLTKTCSIEVKEKKNDKIFLEITPLDEMSYNFPYTKLKLVIQASDYHITQQNLYLKQKVAFNNNDEEGIVYDNACMEININKIISSSEVIEEPVYFLKNYPLGNPLKLNPVFKNYQLIDQRNKR